MKVAVTIQHPAHVHFFAPAIEELERDGHEVQVYARAKPLVARLLERKGIDFEMLAREAGSLPSLAVVQSVYELRLLRRARQFDPDVLVAIGGVAAAHVAAVLDARSVVFYDTEHATLVTQLAYPFADVVCTPEAYRGNLGEKHRQYPGCHELAYLHPDRFTPDPAALDGVRTDPDEQVVLLRLSDWNASHDVGASGFIDPREAVDRLEATGARVVVVAEGTPPATLEEYQVTLPPHRIHHLLASADLYVGEGATMAAESAVLGTPAVYVNTLSMGYTEWLEAYGLLFGYHGHDRHHRALDRAERLLESDADWTERRRRFLEETTDTTRVVLREIERAAER
jgi:predicted glycosyltransferase